MNMGTMALSLVGSQLSSGGYTYAHWYTYTMVKVPCQQPTSFSMLSLKNVCA